MGERTVIMKELVSNKRFNYGDKVRTIHGRTLTVLIQLKHKVYVMEDEGYYHTKHLSKVESDCINILCKSIYN
jgi:hypothetical protein